jgi:hypothetical protein
MLETPFGTCRVVDTRGWETPLVGDTRYRPEESRLAKLSFEKLVINRKDYGSKTLYLARGRFGVDVSAHWADKITPAGRTALDAYFTTNEAMAPYLVDLDPADCRADEKAYVMSELRMALSKVTPSKHEVAGNAPAQRRVDLVDECLEEIVEARDHSVWFTSIGMEGK